MKLKFILVVLAVFFQFSVHALDLESFLSQVIEQHQGLESLRVSIKAAEDARVAGDLELVPELSVQGSYLSDRKLPGMLGATETRNETYSASLSKKFSTGTDISLTAQTFGTEVFGLNPQLLQSLGFPTRYSQGGLGITLNQSLWKNGFGRATRLRQERQALQALLESEGLDLQSRQILTQAEVAFWDYLYLQEQLKVNEASLGRAKRLSAWLTRRVRDGLANRADQLSGESLVASRELQVQASKDSLHAAERLLKDFIGMSFESKLPPLKDNIAAQRDIRKLVGADENSKVKSLDVHLSSLEAKTSEVAAKEAVDGGRANLDIYGSYFTNTYAPDGGAWDATSGLESTDIPTVQVGLRWTYKFDSDIKGASIKAARGRALAAQLRSDRAHLEGETAWAEFLRRHEELSQQIKSALELSKIQANLSKAQEDNYSRGRTITSEVINSEQSAAESELQYIRMCAEQRKLEARSRLFIVEKE